MVVEGAGLQLAALLAADDGVAVLVHIDHKIVVLAQFDSPEHPAPDRAEIDFESWTAIGNRRDLPRSDRIAPGLVGNLRRQNFWGDAVFGVLDGTQARWEPWHWCGQRRIAYTA